MIQSSALKYPISIMILAVAAYFLSVQEGLCQRLFSACFSATEMQYFLVLVFTICLGLLARGRFYVPKLVYAGTFFAVFVSLFYLNGEVGRRAKKPVILHDLQGDALGDYSSIIYRDLVQRLKEEQIEISRARHLLATSKDQSKVELQPGLNISGDRMRLFINNKQTKNYFSIADLLAELGLDSSAFSSLSGEQQLIFINQIDSFALPLQPYEESLNFLYRLIIYQQNYASDLSDSAETKLYDLANVFGGWLSKQHRAIPWFLIANLNFKRALIASNSDPQYLHCAIRAYYHALAYLSQDRHNELSQAISNNLGIALYYQFILQQESRLNLRKNLRMLGWRMVKNKRLAQYGRIKKLNYHLLSASLEMNATQKKRKKNRSKL